MNGDENCRVYHALRGHNLLAMQYFKYKLLAAKVSAIVGLSRLLTPTIVAPAGMSRDTVAPAPMVAPTNGKARGCMSYSRLFLTAACDLLPL